MAIFTDADADALVRTTNVPAGDFTICGFVNCQAQRNTATPFGIDNGTGDYLSCGDSNGLGRFSLTHEGGATTVYSGLFVVGEWVFCAITYTVSGTVYAGYGRKMHETSLTTASGVISNAVRTNLRIGRSPWGSDYWNGYMAGIRIWDAALTSAELLAESKQLSPVRTTSLNAFYPLFDDFTGVDKSGNGRDMTAGTATAASNPPIPWVVGKPVNRTLRPRAFAPGLAR